MEISKILDQVDLGSIALPKFQRGFVWNREQVRGLMQSLYRRYPVGSLLTWVTPAETADIRGDGAPRAATVNLLLDGQQRITSLYGVIRGKPPQFFDGNATTFTGLHFNLESEVFEFYARSRMQGNPLWVDLTKLFRTGVAEFIRGLMAVPELQPKISDYISRLSTLEGIKTIDLHIEVVTGEDKTVDVVVDIFNQVNSGGTKLSKGDLALAKVCAQWPDARREMQRRLEKWRQAGFHFKLDWLLRCVNTITTGEALFTALAEVDTATFRDGLERVERRTDALLNIIAGRLGLDHDRVLGSQYSFPLMIRYLDQHGGRLANHTQRDQLLYWYIHTFLWGRYSASTETVLNQDLASIEESNGALERLLGQLRQNRGDLRIHANDFVGWSRGARFYPLLYMLTRVEQARDWETGIPLSGHLLGSASQLQLHHIFPKALLYRHDYTRSEVNALANMTFLTQETNQRIAARNPTEYLPEFQEQQPGAIESHWLPMDQRLWRVENYADFLTARRELLAAAANRFLDSLVGGTAPETESTYSIEARARVTVPGGVETEDEERQLLECSEWVQEQGLPEGELLYELVEPETGTPLAILDLAWPDGLQEGYSPPVALLLDEEQAVKETANRLGFRFFTTVGDFQRYVEHEILAGAEVRPAAAA